MKKLIFISVLLVSNMAIHALSFVVIASSIKLSTPCQAGSQQYFDFTTQGSYTGADSVKIYMKHINNDSSLTNTEFVYKERFYPEVYNLPVQGDGSRRIYFNLPTDYPTGLFKINMLSSVQWFRSTLEITTGIQNVELKENSYNEKPVYFDLQGRQVTPEATGLYIKMVGNRREKIYFINNLY